MIPFTAVWLYDASAGAYVDLTASLGTPGDTAEPLLGQAADYLYLGLDRRFTGFMSDITAAGSYGARTWAYGVSKTSWISMPMVQNYDFIATRYAKWNLPTAMVSFAFDAVNPHAVAPPDTTARFWVRVSAASVTTVATATRMRAVPYAGYASPVDLQNFMQLRTAFSSSTTPTDLTIEERLRNASESIDVRTRKSWQANFVEEQLYDYNQYGFKLLREPVYDIYELALWTGSSWQNKAEGRNTDFHFEPRTGMVYFTSTFLVPFTAGVVTGRRWRHRFGTFKYPVRVSYCWGYDPEVENTTATVKQIALRLAAIDVLTSMDYTALTSMGLRQVPFEARIERWTLESESWMDRLSSFRMF